MGKDIDLTIRGRDEASDELRDVKKATEELTDSVDQQAKATEKGAFKWTELRSQIELAKKGVEALKKVYEFAREGAALERLEQSSHELAQSMGVDMDEIVEAVSRASRKTISEWDIMAAANKMMLLGVTTDADQMAQVMWSAMERGRAMGRTTMEAFNDIAVGVGRVSPLILDNLGYVFDADTLYSEWAATLGTTADQLDENEKKQALLNMVIKDAKAPTEDALESMERFEVSMDEATVTVKQFLTTALLPTIEGFNTFVAGTDPLDDALRQHIRTIIEADWAYEDIQAEMKRLQDLVPGSINVWALWNEELAKSTDIAEDVEVAIEDLAKGFDKLGEAERRTRIITALMMGEWETAQGLIDLDWQLEKAANTANDLNTALDNLDGKTITAKILLILKQMGVDVSDIDIQREIWRKRYETGDQGGGGGSGGERVWDSRSGSQGGWWYHNFATGGWSRTKNYELGGEFTIGGHGGPDSEPVGFMGTPGEKVKVTRPGEGTEDLGPLLAEMRAVRLEIGRLANILPVTLRDAIERAL